jgi:hypothetical protein
VQLILPVLLTVYENSGNASVTTAKIDLGFSAAVTNVSYDYSVGPFTTATPSGAHVVQGSVTGQQPVARVSFKLANPGTVTTSVGGSYLKGVSDDGTAVVTHSLSGGVASFTYNAPATTTPTNPGTGGKGADQPTTSTPGATNPSAQQNTQSGTVKTTNTGEVKSGTAVASNATTTATDDSATAQTNGAATTSDTADDSAKDNDKHDHGEHAKASNNAGWLWLVIILAAVAGVVAARRVQSARAAKAAAAATEAAAATAAAAGAASAKVAKTAKTAAKKAAKKATK